MNPTRIAAGEIKQMPPTTRPIQPARKYPMWIANSLELGPGIRLLAPSKSRNFSRESHFLRRTSSSSMTAMCAAGPPNAVVPSLRKKRASSASEPFSSRPGTSVPVCSRSAILWFLPTSPSRVQRYAARAREQQKNQPHEHGVVRAACVFHAPEAGLEKNRNFRSGNRRANHNQQRHGGETSAQSHKHQQPANHFHRSYKWTHHMRRGDSDSRKSPRSPLLGKQELLDPLHEKHVA